MCYCFVCDALSPCKYWGKGVSNNDHCHATDKEAKWKTQRQAFKRKILPATYPEKHQNVVYPSTPSPRQQDYYNDYTSEEYRVEDEEEYLDQDKEEYSDQDKEEYSDQDEETTVCVGNLPYGIDSQFLGQLFWYAGVVVFSEVIYDRQTGLSCGYGYVTMSTVQEADDVVKNYHLRALLIDLYCQELYGRLVTVSKAAASASPGGDEAEETPSPCPSTSSFFKLYVANLPWDVDGSELKQLFSEYGEVVHAKVLYNGRGARRRSRGFGFVTMATQQGFEDAIQDLNKQVWRGRKLRVQVA